MSTAIRSGDVDIVPFDAGQLRELVAMWRASFEMGVGVKDPHPIDAQAHYFMTEVVPRHEVRVALLAGELAGFVAASCESIAQLYVRVGVHRRGIGTLLLDWAKRQSGGSLWLYAFARNVIARNFYASRDFIPIAYGFELMWRLDDVKYQWCRTSPAIGLEAKTVRLTAYDPRWPALFDAEALAVRRVLPGLAVAHIGSTAVPGLDAKPVIDVMLGIPELRAPHALYDGLAELGYVHRPDDTLPDRLFFAKDAGRLRTHNLSVCEQRSPFWEAHIAFRDRLRSEPALAHAYVALKRALAAQCPVDRIAYTEGKNDFVASALSGQPSQLRSRSSA